MTRATEASREGFSRNDESGGVGSEIEKELADHIERYK